MATGTMRRVRTIVTGVAGSPYYLNGYFDANEGTAASCVAAWGTFCLPTAADGFQGSVWETEGDVELVDPATGQVIGIEATAARVVAGTTDYDLLPLSNQALVRWRSGIYVDGREIRGRTNLPLQAVGSADDDGRLNSVALAAYNDRAADLIALSTISHVIYSPKNGSWEPTVSGTFWSEFSILRSRRD